MTTPGYNVFFTADCHFYHKNILKHCNGRLAAAGMEDAEDIGKHDQWLIDTWNAQVGKKDHVYILGDFSFANVEWTKRFMAKLKGEKFLVLGNHDATCSKQEMRSYFVTVSNIKDAYFKKSQWGFLEEDLQVSMCHYPMVTWNCKHWGSVQLHGHCHGRLDDYNDASPDLRVDVGLDGRLAGHKLVTLEQVYRHFKEKTDGMPFRQYAIEKRDELNMQM